MSYDKEIFEGKTLSKLFEEIYKNSSKKKSQIQVLIDQLVEMIESPGDAALMVPLIKDYLEASIKNNEHLIKIAGIIQRLENSRGDSEGFDFSELEQWAEEVDQEIEEIPVPEKKDKENGIDENKH